MSGPRRGTALVLCLLLGGCSMRQMIYPAPGLPVGAPPPGAAEVLLPGPGEGRVHGWHLAAARPEAPAVVFFHGNGENLETMRLAGFFDRFRTLDAHLLAIDYPGYGRSPGSPSEAALSQAADAAFAWLGERHPEAPRLVGGWSLGAAVAAGLAARQGEAVTGVILMSAWTSLPAVAKRHFPGPLVSLLLRESYDSLAAAESIRCSALLVHGANDAIIPVSQGRELAQALGGPARWIEIAGAGHNDLLGRDRVWRETELFLAAVSGGAQ